LTGQIAQGRAFFDCADFVRGHLQRAELARWFEGTESAMRVDPLANHVIVPSLKCQLYTFAAFCCCC
jgi:hypothetical protein